MMRWVKLLSESGEQLSLIEYLTSNTVRFWGTVKTDADGIYRIAAYSPDRELKTVKEPIASLEEAQTVVEKFLFDNGTLKEGDEVEYDE